MKRVFALLICAALLLTLGACKKPIGGTPYASGEPYDPPIWLDESSTPADESGESDVSPSVGEESDTTSSTTDGGVTTPGSTTALFSDKTTVGPVQRPGTLPSLPTTVAPSTGGESNPDNEAGVSWTTDAVAGSGTTVSTQATTASTQATTANVSGSTTASTQEPSTSVTTRPTEQEGGQGIRLPAEGYSPDSEHKFYNILQVGTVELSGNTVSIEIKNITPNEHFSGKETEQTSYVEYICYDKDGKELLRDKLRFGRIHKQESRVCEFTIPAGTAKVMLGEWVGDYWSNGFS